MAVIISGLNAQTPCRTGSLGQLLSGKQSRERQSEAGPFRKCSLMNHKPNQQNNQQSTKHKHLKTKPKRQQLGLDRNEGLASTPFQHSWHLTLERRKMDERFAWSPVRAVLALATLVAHWH
ncbi:uncharacterized protein LOC135432842 isoform X2 [Drosophila montana]|uniref:uncharacterized protein LOC135432842 isoform X2 n=1 Tax=Drosophila montana TaxID=40370 RepID=UPI00313C2DD2